MALSRQEKRARNRNLLIIGGVIVVFLVMQSKSLLQALIAPPPPGYAKAAPPGQFTQLDFDVVQEGQWTYGTKPKVPKEVAALQGKPVVVRGFQLPLHNALKGSQFFIAEEPRGCYYCNPPGVAEVIMVNVAGDKQLAPEDWQVNVYGTFHIATGAPSDTVLYWIDDAQVVVAF
jgi:hypothetical protein